MRIATAILSVTVMCMVSLQGCSEPYKAPDNLPTVKMKIGSRDYTLEVAKDDTSRQKGLMDRKSMPANWGMIFVFPRERDLGFWMHNTLIPLDIIFVDAEARVVSVHRMEPLDENTTNSEGPAKYAIELNAGQAKENGVKKGDVLIIPAMALTTSR